MYHNGLLLIPNILSMLSDNLVSFKPRVGYVTIKCSDEANSDCYLLDRHGGIVETATSILV